MKKKNATSLRRATARNKARHAVKFNPEKAVKMFKAGKPVVDIAVAFGYERGQGQNRVRAALVKAGAYKPKAGQVKTATVKGSKVTTMPTGRSVALREVYRVFESRYKKLVGRARTGFAEELSGMVLAGAGVSTPTKISPVELPQDLRKAA
jgi:hypothetical protein